MEKQFCIKKESNSNLHIMEIILDRKIDGHICTKSELKQLNAILDEYLRNLEEE